MLGRHCQAARDPAQGQSPRIRVHHVPPEGVHGGEETRRQGHIIGHQRAMGQDVGLECDQDERDERRDQAKHFPSSQKHEAGQQQGKQTHGGPRRKEQAVGAIGVKKDASAAEVGSFSLRHRRDARPQHQQRQSTHVLDQGRVAGTNRKVAGRQVQVTSQKAVCLVRGLRFLANGIQHRPLHDREETDDCRQRQGCSGKSEIQKALPHAPTARILTRHRAGGMFSCQEGKISPGIPGKIPLSTSFGF